MSGTPFTVERDGRVAVVTFDLPGSPVNTLSRAAVAELGNLLAGLESDAAVEAIVLRSGKPHTFIAGADIREFTALATADEARALIERGHVLLNGLAAMRTPVVVAIDGVCLGGGMELALAAHYRVATLDPATKLGLPEVRLGIIPAAGGCQRLPRLVGLRLALDLILTGRTLDARRAERAGLVDEAVPAAILLPVAVAAAARLATGWRPERRGAKGLAAALLDRTAIGRHLTLAIARRKARRQSGGHYPAPLAAIDAIGHGLAHGITAGLAREATHFAELGTGPVSRRLVDLFFASSALAKDAGVDPVPADVPDVRRLGVVGAGFMGAAVAGVAVLKTDADVRLRDTGEDRVARGLASVRAMLDGALQRRRLDRFEHARRVAQVSGTAGYAGFEGRDLVIEAVFEDLAIKRGIIAEVEAVVAPRAVVASNTSTLPIARLQEGARHPERVIGMHFFSPVDRMPLVEVIRGPVTADWATAATVRFGQRMGKTAVVVRDAPGFWVNRVLAPYLNEAGWLVDEGVAFERIDRALVAFGFPVGPITLLDEVGLDVAGKAAGILRAAFGERLEPAPAVTRLVEAGRLGRKSGAGFYRYEKGRKRPDPAALGVIRPRGGAAVPATALVRRPLLLLLNEAARAFSEGVVRSARDGDVAAVLGFGFPPFLGGPLRYMDDLGAEAVVRELEDLARQSGPRFQPAEVLVEMARTGGRFHGAS
ncbi:MAG: 3-hydroxyacyl-CoA dehydrogenase NAD-binding domain-containing protein [Vicinamibacterales bacterium]